MSLPVWRVFTFHARVGRIIAPENSRGRKPWRIGVGDGTGQAELVFFSPYQAQRLRVDMQICVSGMLERFGDRLSMPHPDYLVMGEQENTIPLLDPVWPLTGGLFPRQLRTALEGAFARFPDLPEWLDLVMVRKRNWPPF